MKWLAGKHPLVITDTDLDGTFSRVIYTWFFEKFISNGIEFDYTIQQTPVSSIDDLQDLFDSHDVIFFSDLGPTPETYEYLRKHNKQIFILDHHKSTRKRLGELDGYTFDNTKSGTKLTFEFFLDGKETYENQALMDAVSYANEYDLFGSDSEKFKAGKGLHFLLWDLMGQYKWNPATFEKVYNLYVKRQVNKCIQYPKGYVWFPYEREIIKKQNKILDDVIKKCKSSIIQRVDNSGLRYGYIEIGTKVSLAAKVLLSELTTLDYLVIYNTFKKDENKMSLRSREGGVDVSEIAVRHGGGGHEPAAGINFTDREFFDSVRLGLKHLN